MSNLFSGVKPGAKGRGRVSPSFWYALGGAFLFGVIAHGMALFNKLSWHDDIFSLFMTGTTVPLGRWMLDAFGEIEKWFYGNGFFSLPVVNGVYSLLCIGLSAGMLAQHFRLRSPLLSALMGAVMAVFPVITSLFGFMYTAHYYMIALAMIVAGGLLICGEGAWWKKISGVLICGCAIGVYQAHIPVLLMVVLLDLIGTLTREDLELRVFGRRLLFDALCVAGVMAVYFLGNQFFLWKENLQLDGYLGISEMGSTSLAQYWDRVCTAYREFFSPSHFTLWDMYPQAMYNVYRLMLCLNAALGLGWFLRLWKKSRVRALLFLAALALVPLGCNFIFVMSEEVHSLMMYAQVMQFVLLVCLADRAEIPFPSLHRLFSLGTALVLVLSNMMYFRYDNQCYLKTQLQQQEAISWNTTLVTRIESIPGFRDDLPVAFVNRREMKDQNLYGMEELQFLSLGTYDEDLQGYLNDWAWEAFLNRWCGFAPEIIPQEDVASWSEIQTMPSYPNDGSIQIIQDVIVVKF